MIPALGLCPPRGTVSPPCSLLLWGGTLAGLGPLTRELVLLPAPCWSHMQLWVAFLKCECAGHAEQPCLPLTAYLSLPLKRMSSRPGFVPRFALCSLWDSTHSRLQSA